MNADKRSHNALSMPSSYSHQLIPPCHTLMSSTLQRITLRRLRERYLLLLHLLHMILRLQQSNLARPVSTHSDQVKSSLPHPHPHPPSLLLSPYSNPPDTSPPTRLQPSAPKTQENNALTILKILHMVSLGCAPTPNQYFALAVSSLISLIGFPSPSGAGLGMGS